MDDKYKALLDAARNVVNNGQINPFNPGVTKIRSSHMAALWDAVHELDAVADLSNPVEKVDN